MSKLAIVNGVIMRLKEVEEVSVAEVEKLLADARAEVVHIESLLSQIQGGAQPAAPANDTPSGQPSQPATPPADPTAQGAPADAPAAPAEPAALAAPDQPVAPAADPNAAPAAPADPNAAPILQ